MMQFWNYIILGNVDGYKENQSGSPYTVKYKPFNLVFLFTTTQCWRKEMLWLLFYEVKVPDLDRYNTLLSILLKAYSDVPPMYFPIPGHPLISKNISLSCPPPVLANTGEGHDSKNIFSIMSLPCIGQYRGGGYDSEIFLLISG